MERESRIQYEEQALASRWQGDARWDGIERTYGPADVVRLRGSVVPEQTLARLGAERLWQLLPREAPVRALGTITGGPAVQMIKADIEANQIRQRQ
jgi:isocitrate lyase